MAFTDALIDHADVHVTLVDRRHAAGGHWHDAYPFVQLHQASQFYGVASTLLGTGAVQDGGPEAGLHERARRSEITNYYDDILYRRFLGSGQVTFLGGSEYHSESGAHLVTSLVSGETIGIDVRRRVVDATYLSPTIPATSAPPFGVAEGARVIAVGQLSSLTEAPDRFVIVGSGKTATDAVVWLITKGVSPERITWVRPREPWMLNRAMVQPDPVVALEFASDTMLAAIEAESLEEMFLRLEAAGVMLRIDSGQGADDGQGTDPRHLGTRPSPHHRARRAPGSHQTCDEGRDRPRRRRRNTGPWLAGDPLCGGGAELPTAGPPLATGHDSAADDPGRIPVFWRRTRRLRGSNPRG